jgi:hypothetical protein
VKRGPSLTRIALPVDPIRAISMKMLSAGATPRSSTPANSDSSRNRVDPGGARARPQNEIVPRVRRKSGRSIQGRPPPPWHYPHRSRDPLAPSPALLGRPAPLGLTLPPSDWVTRMPPGTRNWVNARPTPSPLPTADACCSAGRAPVDASRDPRGDGGMDR